jgi:predicted nuclease of predicted toxin-antitoxin system
VRLLLDEMISPTIAGQLRERDIDVDSVAGRLDLVQLPDEQVLAIAAAERRVVVTFDIADFALLASTWGSQGRSHSGILYVSSAAFPQDRALIGAMVTALAAAVRDGSLPGPDETGFLTRRPGPSPAETA